MDVFNRRELEKLEKTQLIEIIQMLAGQTKVLAGEVKMLAGEVSEVKARLKTNSGM